MKPYGELPWWCQVLDPWFGPPWYAEIEDFDAWRRSGSNSPGGPMS